MLQCVRLSVVKITLLPIYMLFSVYVPGEVKTTVVETETVKKPQLNEISVPNDADDNDSQPLPKNSLPDVAAVSSEAQPAVAAKLELPSSENGLDPTSRDSVRTSDHTAFGPPAADPPRVADKLVADGGAGVSCVRDLINSAIEKTLQDTGSDQRHSRTPSPAVGG